MRAGPATRAARPSASPAAFRETRLDPELRLPRWLALSGGAALTAGPLVAWGYGRERGPLRVLRAVLVGSAIAYGITMALDAAEHFRLERAVTGRMLRWRAVPLSESALHLAVLGSLLSAVLMARRPRGRRVRGPDRATVLAPAAFLAIGWLDELVYHRRRVLLREEIIHATEHIAEGMLWTSLYALRMLRKG
ncbi:MAG: hypothetical protein JOZ69_14840 [Myxococcales bacterium]|nr:hypothetical protein [Myxococcales bacterium]